MSEKWYTPKEAAVAVLKKAEELLKKSSILQKYETENSDRLGYFPSKINQKEENPKDYKGERIERQIDPRNNPKERAEGNNKEYGEEPKNMGKAEKNPDEKEDAELGENVEHLVEDHAEANKEAERKEGHKLLGKSEALKKKYYGFKAVEEKAKESGASNPAAVAAAAGRKKYGKKAFQEAAAKGKKMHKMDGSPTAFRASEKMDKHGLSAEQIKQKIGKSEMNKHGLSAAQIKAKLNKKEGKSYPQDLASENIKEHMHHLSRHPGGKKQAEAIGIEQAREGEHEAKSEHFMPPKSIGSAKLSAFMQRIHAKRKLRNKQE